MLHRTFDRFIMLQRHHKNYYDNYYYKFMVSFPPTNQVISTHSSNINFIFLQTMTFQIFVEMHQSAPLTL